MSGMVTSKGKFESAKAIDTGFRVGQIRWTSALLRETSINGTDRKS